MSIESAALVTRNRRWPWVVLGLGIVWTVIIRIPLVLNAEDHLDSDLAVDGLTLVDAINGHWRWHYPGTPHMGILPVLSSYLQALVWGVDAVTLVSGGTVMWVGVIAASFLLAAKTFGSRIAAWALVPLVFSNVGTIWLSGRITGGHLLTLFWHIGAFIGVQAVLACGGRIRVAALGLWCGLGVYLDAMFLISLIGIGGAIAVGWTPVAGARRLGSRALWLVVGLSIGLVPLELGRRFDPYDAYSAQFAATFDPATVASHARLMAFHCLPRLLAGTELSKLERWMPRDRASRSSPNDSRRIGGGTAEIDLIRESLVGSVVLGFVVAVGRLGLESFSRSNFVRRGVSFGVVLSATAVAIAFMLNRSIFNSDNYRYLIFLLVPWTLGFGLLVEDLAARSGWGRYVAILAIGLFAFSMSWQVLGWYRDIRQYVGPFGNPVRLAGVPYTELTIQPDESSAQSLSPRRPWKYEIPRDVTHVFGGYWDVYKISFLSGGRIIGIPLAMFPNRFQGWSRGLGAGRGKLLIFRPSDGSASGSRPASETRGGRSRTVRSAKRIDWRPALTTVWELDGRDRADVDRLNVIVP